MFGLLFIGAMESTKIDDLGHNPEIWLRSV